MKSILKLIGLTVLDFVLIWVWVKAIDPDPSVSIYTMVLVPLVFLINIVIAGILYFLKNSNSSFFFINSIVASILMSMLFDQGIRRHQDERLDSWKFTRNDTIYGITNWKTTGEVTLSSSVSLGSSSSSEIGYWELRNDSIILKADSYDMYIVGDYLINFNNDSSRIKVEKIR